jgi:solute carrier family 13 (sodium-dependent dicarboxylate transporter), member 2/3/5
MRVQPLDTTSRRGAVALVAAVVIAATIAFVPPPAGLSPQAQRTAAIFALALVLWATEATPIAVTALLTVLLQPVLGITTPRQAFQSFMSPVFFFVLAAFVLASGLIASGLQGRFSSWLVARAGTDPRRLLFALMAGTATLSTVLSDVPTCAIFMVAALGVMARGGIRPGSNFGKAVMVGIPMASMIGGVGTPAGSSVNVLGLYFIEQFGKVRVPFLSWMIIGIPMVVVLVPLAWWVLVRFFPPEIDSIGSNDEVRQELAALGPLSRAEWKIIVLFAALLTAWIASTWVPALDIVVVAMVGAVVLFLPGMQLLSWSDTQREIGWDALIMIGAVTSLGAASTETGLAKWTVEALLGGVATWSPTAAVAAVSAFTVVAHLPIPIAPAINSALIPPVVVLASNAGHNPALYGLPVAFTASCAFLLPLDAVSLITYAKGYYRMIDMLLPGTVVSVAWVILMTVLMTTLGPMLGLL